MREALVNNRDGRVNKAVAITRGWQTGVGLLWDGRGPFFGVPPHHKFNALALQLAVVGEVVAYPEIYSFRLAFWDTHLARVHLIQRY